MYLMDVLPVERFYSCLRAAAFTPQSTGKYGMPKSVSDQVVIIIGASSGLGRQTALELADRGATVVISSRSEQALESLADELDRRGAKAVMAVPCDVTDDHMVDHLVAVCVERFGRIDTLMVMPAVTIYARVEHTTLAEYERVLDVNYLGYVRAAKSALRIFRRQGYGTLINVASALTGAGLPLQSAYASAAQSTISFTRTLHEELQGTNIDVSLVLAGSMATPLATKHARSKTGMMPKSMGPVSHPKTVAKKLVKCAERPAEVLTANLSSKAFYPASRAAPGLLGRMLGAVGDRLQMTRHPEASHGHDNVDEPMPGEGSVLGAEEPTVQRLGRWARSHPGRVVLGAAVLAVAAFAFARSFSHGMRG